MSVRIMFMILIGSSLVTTELLTKNKTTYGDFTCQLDRVVDGDTLKCQRILGLPSLIGEDILVRLRGIDTPELRAKDLEERAMAQYVKTVVEEFIDEGLASGLQIELKQVGRGKYFRLVADVFVGEKSLSEFLLQAQLSCPYEGGKRQKLAEYIEDNKLNCLLF